MGSICSKAPIVSNEKPKKQISNYSKLNDYRKKYEYSCILGNGAFGKVRLFRDKENQNMKYAIKTIKKDGISDTMKNCILEEVNILRKLDSPNIVKYYETYEDENYIHIVMEYLQGEDLFKIISNRKYNNYSEIDAADMMKQLLKAVKFIHSKKIVHRDLKPENILFSVNGDYKSLKLIDFGLSTQHLSKKQTVGSPYYMAPEIIDGKYTYKTDIWSIGVILYVLMTGKYPFTGKKQEEVFYKIQNENYNENYLNKSKCSEQVKKLISRLLVKDEKDRLSIEEALADSWFKLHKIKDVESDSARHLDEDILDSIKQFTSRNYFQKEVLFYIAKLSRDEEITNLKEAFIKLDKDNTGTLTIDEVFTAFKEIGVNVEKKEIDTIWEGLDFHKDNEVNYTEFLAATISSLDFLKEEKIWSAFKYFESHTDSGYITADSVINALKACELAINEDALIVFFQKFDKSGKKLDFEEFKNLVFTKE